MEQKTNETAVLVALDTGENDVARSLTELAELAKSAGADILGFLTQKKDAPDPATYIGPGRLSELRTICENNCVDLIIFDDELSPSQQRNIELATDVRVIDRTMLILDIFAARAKTSEGKLQVELAQLNYMLPRLTGRGTEMSRLGGGIGTRGPGESKLESDRRHIRRRIHKLEESFAELEKRRGLHRTRRQKDRVTTVAIVGYTNAGKSTLLNYLTGAGVLAEDKLFATLDPTSRALRLSSGDTVMLIDTVGFISRLPHKLVEAFKSTLEEAADADLILNICDASDPSYALHLSVTRELLKELGAENTPVINVLNKCDAVEDFYTLPSEKDDYIKISALTGAGIPLLLDRIARTIGKKRSLVKIFVPYPDGSVVSELHEKARVTKEEYREDGTYMEVIADTELLEKVKKYIGG